MSTRWTIDSGPARGQIIHLLSISEFNDLLDGTLVMAIDGSVKMKGRDHIDLDTRFGYTAWGVPESAMEGNTTSPVIKGFAKHYPERRIKD